MKYPDETECIDPDCDGRAIYGDDAYDCDVCEMHLWATSHMRILQAVRAGRGKQQVRDVAAHARRLHHDAVSEPDALWHAIDELIQALEDNHEER